MTAQRASNHLICEKSPYLLQHAHNPVDWYPWGDEAFERARREQKPIFLSVGYSTCHWCHVMERESFENEETASILNQHFVCIKVDREERPDVDKVYMTALQAMGQNGGWPMSMFLTPDLRPFYGGTYFPPDNRYGRAGFPDVLRRIHEVWSHERDKVLDSAEKTTSFLQNRGLAAPTRGQLDMGVLRTCFDQLRRTYDETFGGFGGSPKFPRPVVFSFLLRYHGRTSDPDALEMVRQTLEKISRGGIYDHLGGGFHRYAVDAEWRVPHFEKMLYDQAQLVLAYLDLIQVTHDHRHAAVVRGTLDYVLRDLTENGFLSAEDADSARAENTAESGEGAFYVWTRKEILHVLGEDLGMVFCFFYGVEAGGNVPVDPHLEFSGKNILYAARTPEEVANEFRIPGQEVHRRLVQARERLYERRSRRPRPLVDDKILTSWNGLMISALSRASQVLGVEAYRGAAVQSAEFILGHLVDPNGGRLKRRFRDGEAKFDAQLEDYAFLTAGLLDLYEADPDVRWLREAVKLTQRQIDLFWDPEAGGFYDTSGDDLSILVRMKGHYDGAEPAGNSIAATNLLRLAFITDNDDWKEKAEQTIAAFAHVLRSQPVALPQMAVALDMLFDPPRQIVIVGRRDDRDTQLLLRTVYDRFIPNRVLLLVDPSDPDRIEELCPFVSNFSMIGGSPSAYVCQDFVCQLPVTEPAALGQLLDSKR